MRLFWFIAWRNFACNVHGRFSFFTPLCSPNFNQRGFLAKNIFQKNLPRVERDVNVIIFWYLGLSPEWILLRELRNLSTNWFSNGFLIHDLTDKCFPLNLHLLPSSSHLLNFYVVKFQGQFFFFFVRLIHRKCHTFVERAKFIILSDQEIKANRYHRPLTFLVDLTDRRPFYCS